MTKFQLIAAGLADESGSALTAAGSLMLIWLQLHGDTVIPMTFRSGRIAEVRRAAGQASPG